MRQFTLQKAHLLLMKQMNIGYDDYCEFGAPKVDPKRPYGNGDVYNDIAKILNLDPFLDEDGESVFSPDQKLYMLTLHKETAIALEIIVETQAFELGKYVADDYKHNWIRYEKETIQNKARPD